MVPAISIYSRRRFSINYYCCACNPGELKTNKRVTTETDSLGSLKNSFIFSSSRSRNFPNHMRRSGGGQLRALVPPTPKGAQIIKYVGDKWVTNRWAEKARLRRRTSPAGLSRQVLDPDPRAGLSLPRKAATGNQRRGRCGERRHAARETKGRRR